MSTQRVERISEMIRQDVAASIYHIVNDPDFDPSAVTITHALVTPDLRHAKIFVSIRADEERKKRLLQLLFRHRKEFQASIGRNVVMKYTPHIVFELDQSIERGGHVLDLISKMETEHPDWVEKKTDES